MTKLTGDKSKCCNADTFIGGIGDFKDKDKASTRYYVCTACNKPCDVVKKENIIAIDPGITGGIAIFTDTVKVEKMPIKKVDGLNIVDVKTLRSLFSDCKTLIIEDIMLLGHNGGNKTAGSNYGRILAIAEMKDMNVVVVRPQTWQKVILPGIKGRKELKQAGIDKVNKLYPDTLPKLGKTGRGKKYHDGCADAVLIGLWYKETKLK